MAHSRAAADVTRSTEDALTHPVLLHLTGPGGGTWSLAPSTDAQPITVVAVDPAESDHDAIIASSADDFQLWGTHRVAWRDAGLTLSGDVALATAVCDALRVF